jgi:VWFA-related protein
VGKSSALGLLILAATLGGGAVASTQVGGGRGRPAEQPPPIREEQRPVIRVGVDAIVVDVSVLDEKGQPVTGLTADDFTILDAGRPRAITTFQAVHLAAPVPAPVGWPAYSLDVVRNDPGGDPRALVIILDDATMPAGWGHWVVSSKRIAARIVEEMRPGDVAAILRTREGGTQDFTADRARLLRFIEAFRPGTRQLDPREAGSDRQFLHAPLKVMSDMAGFLAALPDRRKLMFYVGVGVPIDSETIAQPLALSVENMGARAGQGTHERAQGGLQELVDRARRNNVYIYTFDPSGVGGIEQAVFSATADVRNPQTAASEARQVSNRSHNFLQAVAENTGGRAVIQTNAPHEGVAAAFAENQSFYLLGYTDDGPAARRKSGEITVRVRQPGLVVRHRRNLKSDAGEDAVKKTPQTPFDTIMANADLPMQIWAAPYWNAARKEPAVAVVVGLRPASPASGTVTDSTEVTIVAFDDRAKPHGGHTVKADLAVQPTPVGWIPYEIVSELRLKPGTYRIRAAAQNPRLGKTGSVFTDVDVPDFAKARLTMSGLALVSTPRWAAFPKDRLSSLLPLAPSTRRHFSSSDVIELFAMLHQRGGAAPAAVDLRVTIVDERGARVFERASVVEAAAFAEGGAGVPLRFAPSTFTRGRFLLTLHASLAGHSVERSLTFQVD